MTKYSETRAGFSSPPCYAHELELSGNGYLMADVQTTIEVERWRKAKRAELIAARLKISGDDRRKHATRVANELEQLIEIERNLIVSAYWPFKGEVDLRFWMREIIRRGCHIALPVVVEKGKPLQFRAWNPGARMKLGIWNIPVPVDEKVVMPDVIIAPLVGFDPDCYRLGYGGGYYDRTLVSLSTRPKVIGVGHPCGALNTIFPQPHDIPMDFIVTGE